MAQNYGPTIVTDGLILNLDAADVNSYPGPTLVDVMVVGGGGGGGMDMGGGGGGGGVVYQQNYAVTPGTGITVTVGAGGWGAPCGSGCYRGDGAGPQPSSHQFTIGATAGGNSVFGSITAYGGGFGASSYYGYTPNYGVGGNGGSGGGASGYTAGATVSGGTGTTGQGYRGGNSGGGSYYSGGGGGAGGAGADGPNQPNGGPGILIPEMSPFYFGGGGGGASYSLSTGGNGGIGGGGGGALGTTTGGAGINNGSPGGGGSPGMWANTPGGNAGANTGGGGGGGSHYNATNQGGNGGSGIVIVRYQGPQGATGGTVSYRNGYTYHTFTSSGTFTPGGDTTWYNTSNPSLNASLVNGVTYSSSNKGALILDGTDDIIYAPSVNQLGVMPNNAFEIWVKSPGLGPGKTIGGLICPNYGMVSYIEGGGNVVYQLYSTDSSPFGYIVSLGSSGVNCFDNQWHHIVCTRGYGIGAYIYIDGVVRGSTGGGSLWSGNNIWGGMNTQIGNNPNDVYYNLNGRIGLAKIYNKYLTATEVLQNYTVTKTRFGL